MQDVQANYASHAKLSLHVLVHACAMRTYRPAAARHPTPIGNQSVIRLECVPGASTDLRLHEHGADQVDLSRTRSRA